MLPLREINRPDQPPPNLGDYDRARADFSWEHARSLLAGLPDGGRNIAHEAVDRHLDGPVADKVALRWLGRKGDRRDLTYHDLATETSRFAGVLDALGVDPGDVLFTLMGRQLELYVAVLGALRAGVVVSPLFAAFGPEPVQTRVELGAGRVLVTTESLYRRRIAPIRDQLPTLEHVFVVTDADEVPPGTLHFRHLLAEVDPSYKIAATRPDDPALLHFTSGTTGTPKGALHVHDAVVYHHVSGRLGLDLHDDDTYWCTADPGWVTGMSYGIIAPLTCGVTSIIDEGEFDADRWYSVIEEERVDVWYTAPTAVRMLMRAGAEVATAHDLSSLRFVGSVGEPLNPEAVVWGAETLGHPIHDNWWQSETGGIMIANFAGCEIRPGSMGRPMPGIDAAVLARDDDGGVLLVDGQPVVLDDGESEGHLALRAGWPSMFRGYLGQEERYRSCFVGEWYVSGDLARREGDGWFWFVGRSDDVIKSGGHLIGPFEVESALMEHPAVVEAGVIGKPDPVAGDVVKAFVTLRPGYEPSDELMLELIGFARKRLGATIAPREIAFDQDLPRTRSGKIMRRLLRARELGLPEGDLSTLERPE